MRGIVSFVLEVHRRIVQCVYGRRLGCLLQRVVNVQRRGHLRLERMYVGHVIIAASVAVLWIQTVRAARVEIIGDSWDIRVRVIQDI